MADLKLRKAAKPALYLLLTGLMALPRLGVRVTRRPTNQRTACAAAASAECSRYH